MLDTHNRSTPGTAFWKIALLLVAIVTLLAAPLVASASPQQDGSAAIDAPSHGGNGNGNGNGNGHGNDDGEDDEGEDEGEDEDDHPGPPGLAESLIKFDQRTFTVFESIGEAIISVERSKGEDGEVVVDYWTEDGSATAGEDYTPVSGTLTWPDGDDDRQIITIPILEDEDFEVRETIRLFLEVVSGEAQLHPGQGSAVLQIIDASEDNDSGEDDEGPGEIEFEDDEFQAVEGDANAQVVIVREDGSDGAVSVAWSTADGSATAGDDYSAASGIVSWGDGEDGPRAVEVPILEDDLEEGNETVVLILSDPTGGATIEEDEGEAELIILDNDGDTTACVEDAETLCLADDRFQVQVDWRTQAGDSGTGKVEEVSDNSGLVWFFNQDNKEILVKVLDACEVFDTYWVFFAATTNVDFTLTVTDTATGIVKEYTNPAGQAAEPVQDTFTFETCDG